MTRTQIQLPDELYRDLKRLAEAQEWTLAETLRRGAELLLRSYPRDPEPASTWQLPEPVALGNFVAPVSDWRRLANEDDAP
ncbi:MAG: antitoxin [Alphaproteobacteria bacterium]|nr:antitoxin [Alphaproteobacteria bacterium]MCB9699475.1 antitoxin [Alphaproteobacteria bacterium]